MHKHYKSLGILAVFLLFTLPVKLWAQGKLTEGYVLTSENDTIKGYIRYENWDSSPSFIYFSTNIDSIPAQLSIDEVSEFYISRFNERYRGKKIGVLNIDLSQTYTAAPSFVATDSVGVFLRVLAGGSHALLLEYVNALGESHFFIEKNGKTTELINYPFYRITNEKKYLLTYDEYRRQLPAILSDSPQFEMAIPAYDAKSLSRYVNKYNATFGEESQVPESTSTSDFSIDLFVFGGIEGWKENGIDMKSSPFFGAGLRLDLPRKFQNRYFRINFSVIPGISNRDVYTSPYTPDEETSLQTLEIGSGTHFGSGNIRPYLGIDYSFPLDNWRLTLLGPHVGISFRRQLSLEIAHFGNFNSLFSEVPFFNRPRISLNYHLDLVNLFSKK